MSPPAAQQLAPNQGHLGWDKAAGARLADPTASLSIQPAAAPAGLKTGAYQTASLTFRSGYQTMAGAGLDHAWLSQAAGAGPSAPVYGVIQFPLPFDTEARLALEKAGVKFYNYVPGGGLYARLPAGAVNRLQGLAAAGRVLQAGPIPAAARIDPALAAQAAGDPEARVPVVVQFFEPPDAAQLTQVARFVQVESASLHPALPLVQGTLRAGDAAGLAGLPFVRWLELGEAAVPANLESTMSLATDILRLDDPLGSTGAGVRVGVIDTGLMQNPYHADLPAARVADQYEFFPGSDPVAEDQYGHGTHVAGTLAGSGAASGADLGLQGHAPGAELLIYKLCCSSGYGFFSAHFQEALVRGAARGMQVVNNSWGGGNGVYTTNAEIADRAVRGEYGRYMALVVSAGNDNTLVRSPGTAKNVITVGALKSGNSPNQVIAGCGDTNWAPAERVCFSNYGPIDTDGDGRTRLKPDLMADGVLVRSSTPFGYVYYNMSGTSMAAPAVSGAIAVLLDHYSESAAWLADWPETMKALLLASAADLGGPPGLYGRGLPNLQRAAYASAGGPGHFWGNALTATGETVRFTFAVPAGYSSVRLALTWPDPAGGAEVANDLDLYVYSNAGCLGAPAASSTTLDDTVEFVSVAAGLPDGTWCAEVTGASLSSPQTFGLAAFPDLTPPLLSVSAQADNLTPAPGQIIQVYTTLVNSGSAAPGAYVRLSVPAGLTLQSARAYAADGRSFEYAASELYAGGGAWHFAVGQAAAGFPRLVRWTIRVDDDALPGAYQLAAAAFCKCSAPQASGGNSHAVLVFVGGHTVFVPLVSQ